MNRPQPVIKSAGGKRKLLPEILPRIPKKFNMYHEPFLGGGAVFFGLFGDSAYAERCQKGAVLSDNNPDIMCAFEAVRALRPKFLEKLEEYQKSATNKDHYYRIRSESPTDPDERAARFIYLNKTCYNGLTRVNKSGDFNMPFGKYKNPKIFRRENLEACHRVLEGARLLTGHYGGILERATTGDLVYFDPPYLPRSVTENFTSYTKDGFSYEDHVLLAQVVWMLHKRGVKCLVSNSDTDLSRNLYKDFRIEQVYAARSINSKGWERGKVPELLISTYDFED